MDNNENTSLRPDSLLGEFTNASESRISETREVLYICLYCVYVMVNVCVIKI